MAVPDFENTVVLGVEPLFRHWRMALRISYLRSNAFTAFLTYSNKCSYPNTERETTFNATLKCGIQCSNVW